MLLRVIHPRSHSDIINIMSGLLPGCTRKDIEQLPNFFSAIGGNAKHVIYPPRSPQAQ